MNNPITDVRGQTVLTGIATHDCDGYSAVFIGFGDTDDKDGPHLHPVLLLEPVMAMALARDLAGVSMDTDDAVSDDPSGHSHAVLTGRLLLAAITDDDDALGLTIENVGNCIGCWQRIATQLLGVATSEMVENQGRAGAIRMAEDFIADMLEASDEDEDQP